MALNLDNPAWADRSAEALRAALRERPASVLRDDSVTLAKALAEACEHLPRSQAAEHAAQAIDDAVARLREPAGTYASYNTIGPAMVTLSPYLDAAAAKRTAEAIDAIVSRSHPISREVLARSQLAVCRQLPASDSAVHVNRMLDLVFQTFSKTKDEYKYSHYTLLSRTLATLSGKLERRAGSGT